MNQGSPKLNTLLLLVIAIAATVIAFVLLRSNQSGSKVIYIDTNSGKVYEKVMPANATETQEEKLRREYPGGKVY